MANARLLMEARIMGVEGNSRCIELLRPGKAPWRLGLPASLDQGQVTPALVDYVTVQYLVDLPAEGVRLGWETVYALVRAALEESLGM
jgi:hypothetical protein